MNRSQTIRFASHRLLAAPLLALALLPAASSTAPREIFWQKQVLDRSFRAEGASAADVNRDGTMDVFAGNLWYEAPDWKAHEIRPPKEFTPATGYSDCFSSFAEDVDRDGWPDQVVVGFPGDKTYWYRNPGRTGDPWERRTVCESTCNESPLFEDLDDDRRPELIAGFQEKRMAFYTWTDSPQPRYLQHFAGKEGQPGCNRFSHGLGLGDVDGDGAPDILCTDGYYRSPLPAPRRRGLSGFFSRLAGGEERRPPTGRDWEFVPAPLGPNCAQMFTLDFDGDGDRDVFSSSAHAIGVWWHERKDSGPEGRPAFTRHTIDDSFSQSHAVAMADINGDGRPDFVTGKRWWAHGPTGDVNPNDPAVLYWYEFQRDKSGVKWTRHPIDNDSGVGTQFTVRDMNRDGRPDIVISNKKGVFVFVHKR